MSTQANDQSTCASLRISTPKPVLESKELSASELFQKAYEKQAKELEPSLVPAFHVNINHMDRNAFQQNYALDLLLVSTPTHGDSYLLNAQSLKNYAYVNTAKVSSGHLILEINDDPTRVPLVDGYIRQVHREDAVINITVSKKKLAM